MSKLIATLLAATFAAATLTPVAFAAKHEMEKKGSALAEACKGNNDAKLTGLVDIVTQLLRDGFNPIVFCRYISTAKAVGAALANKKHGRLTVNIQCDGDLNYAPGVLWTAAHHQIPLLNIMHNNRAYHEERMYLALLGAKYNRGVERSDIGTAISGPDIDYAGMAKSFGMHAQRVEREEDLAQAIQVALQNRPALLDVLVTPEAASSDAKSGLAWVPDLQALAAWDDAERQWRGAIRLPFEHGIARRASEGAARPTAKLAAPRR